MWSNAIGCANTRREGRHREDKKENCLFNGDVFGGHRDRFLQLHLTIEDEGIFPTPWTATLTYVPGRDILGDPR
jgi:hypothetical protein